MGRAFLLLCAALLLCGASAPDLSRFDEVDAAPVKTSIYVGSVTLIAGPFRHAGGRFTASYVAKVFPYFFANEAGRLVIEVPDELLRQLAAGRTIHFTGRGIRSDGTIRPVEGVAAATGPSAGTLQVKIHVTRHLTLSFATTYRLPKASETR